MKAKSYSKQQINFRRLIGLLMCMSGLPIRAATTESNLTKSFAVKPGGYLLVDVDRGSIRITTSDRPDLQVEVKRKIMRGSSDKAQEVFAAHEVNFSQDGDHVGVHAKFKEGFRAWLNRAAQSLEVEYQVLMPRKFNLDLRTAAGEITATDVEGMVKAKTSGGSLRFASIKGPFEGVTSAGGIVLDSASGPVSVKTSGGSIQVGQVDAETTAVTSAGSIKIGISKGALSAKTSGGRVEVGEADGPAELETSAGSIRVNEAKAKLAAKSAGGSIEVGLVAGPGELRTSAGSIHVKTAQAALQARTSGGGIVIEDAQDTVIADTSAGSIKAAFSAQPQGDCRLSTSGGSIEVKLGEELAFDIDARASGGHVRTSLPVTTTVVGRPKADVLEGKLHGGGKALILKTAAGNISIEKR